MGPSGDASAPRPAPATDESPGRVSRTRVPSLLFNPAAFAFTAAALLLAPIAAELNVFRSYTPFLLLRFWMIGFCVYGIVLAQRAGGLRIAWRVVYTLMAIPFAFVW